MKFGTNPLQLRTKLIMGFGLPLLLMVAVTITVYENLERLQSSSKWVSHTHEAIANGRNLLLSMIDMETGLRGYLVAGKQEFLEPYDQGQKDFASTVERAKEHVSDNPKQVALLACCALSAFCSTVTVISSIDDVVS